MHAVAATHDTLRAALDAGGRPAILAAADAVCGSRAGVLSVIGQVDERPESRTGVRDLLEAITQHARVDSAGEIERTLLVAAALDATPRLAGLAVCPHVREMMRAAFEQIATAPDASRFELSRATFVDAAKKTTLRRFTAGQFDWEIGGISRSDVLH